MGYGDLPEEGEYVVTIPEPLREAFQAHMKAADNTMLTVNAWMHQMLEAADAFLAQHNIDWEPRAALVYYLKTPYLEEGDRG